MLRWMVEKREMFMETSPRVLILEGIHKKAEELLTKAGFQVEYFSQTLSSMDLIRKLQGVSLLCSRSRTEITGEVFANTRLSALGAFCIGVNQIDLQSASREGVPVFNAPYSNTRSVAELVVGLIIALSRKIFFLSQKAHGGQWEKSATQSHEVRGKTLGIIGYGHIGSQVSVLSEAMGMKVIYYDIASRLPLGNARAASSLEEILKLSDFITLHVPQTNETRGMIGKEQIALMKKGAFFINTSRGEVVKIPPLKEALTSGLLRGAALDVFPKEPKSNQEAFESPLQNLENVILTPHIGGSTEEAQESIAREVSENLISCFFLGTTQGTVNFPLLTSPPLESGTCRILNVHKNQPGVLGKINQLISKSSVNIRAQYLSTNESIGYLVMDVEKEDGEDLRLSISKLDTSIRTRVIPGRRDEKQR